VVVPVLVHVPAALVSAAHALTPTSFSAKDPKALSAWYKTHLGIDVQDWGGAAFDWTDADGNPTKGTTAWLIDAAGGNHRPGNNPHARRRKADA
jgi:hypothetical protein